tara:strand:+ start:67 stop:714 length:648 start_codon:yes stop_codon:yes gene_type:complete
MKYSIVIPCYNEQNLSHLLTEIQDISNAPLIVIDDASDNPSIKDTINENLYILRNKKNKGKGYSILKGIAKSNSLNCNYTLVMDADGQHSPSDINLFLKNISDKDLVLGYRDFYKNMPLHRVISNKIASFIISFIVGQNIKDSQCGFRLYKNSLFNLSEFSEKGFQFESEFLLKKVKKIKIMQIPIKTIYNSNNISKINYFSDSYKFIKLIIKYI